MRIQSCMVRYGRFVVRSCACSIFTFFINSSMLVNKTGFWIVSGVLFLLVMLVDTWIFSVYFGKNRHLKYGIYYPYALFIITSYICSFAIRSSRWRYFFLPLGVFENYGLSRLASVSLSHLIIIVLTFVISKMGQKKFYKNN